MNGPSYPEPGLAGTCGIGLTCCAVVLVAFARLVMQPGGWLADAGQPAIDRSIPPARRTVGNDLIHLFIPHHLSIARALHETKRIPSWDPRGFGGRPLAANPQAGLWYPANWLIWFTRDPSLFGWLTVAHLIGGAIALAAVARSMGLSRTASTLAACAFALNPYLIAQVAAGHIPQTWAACWIPLFVLGLRHWAAGNPRGGLAAALAFALMTLAGHPQIPYLVALASFVWLALFAARRWRQGTAQPDARGPRAALGLVLVLLPLAITAVQWLPVLLAEPWVLGRSRSQAAEVDRYAVGLKNLLQLVDPLILGGPGSYTGAGTYPATQLGVGAGVAALAIVALRARSGQLRGLAIRLALFWLVAIVMAAGRSLGASTVLGAIVPGMARFRVPGRILFLVAPAVALMAAIGLDRLRQWRPHARVVPVAIVGACLFQLVVDTWLVTRVEPGHRFLGPVVETMQAAVDAERGTGNASRLRADDRRFTDLDAFAAGVEKVNVEDWFQIQHAADLYEALYTQFGPPRPVEWFNPLNSWIIQQERQAVLDRMSVRWLISGRTSQPTLRPNESALPRAYVVPRSVPDASGQSAPTQLAFLDARSVVMLEGADPLTEAGLPPAGPRQAFRPARYQVRTNDEIEIDVETTAPGLLVVADTWMPGWTALVNGQPASVLRGNRGQRVIALPRAGAQHAVLRYQAPGLAAGMAISLAGLAIWASMAIVLCFRSSRGASGYTTRASTAARRRAARATNPTA